MCHCCLQLDFSIVVVSVVVLILDTLAPNVQWLKALRVLRALKPLRSALTILDTKQVMHHAE